MYDPSIGRFISVDPTGFAAGDANLYRYVGNNPTNATDPTGLVKLTAKSVGDGPQAGLYPEHDPETKPHFSTYWGVALYLDKAGLDELKKAGGGYIVSHRTIKWKFENYTGDNKKGYRDEKEGSVSAWFLDPILFNAAGDLVTSDTSRSGKGGPRVMADNSIAAAYLSVIQGYLIPFTKGTITVTDDYWLYSGVADQGILDKFGRGPKPSLPSGLGYDEYVHKPWSKDDPKIKGDPLLKGEQIKGTITWDNAATPPLTFDSPNTAIPEGPQRDNLPEHQARFPAWVYKGNKWIRLEQKSSQQP